MSVAPPQSVERRRLVVRGGLERLGFRVLTHRLVAPNDGRISYGEAAVAARRTSCA